MAGAVSSRIAHPSPIGERRITPGLCGSGRPAGFAWTSRRHTERLCYWPWAFLCVSDHHFGSLGGIRIGGAPRRGRDVCSLKLGWGIAALGRRHSVERLRHAEDGIACAPVRMRFDVHPLYSWLESGSNEARVMTSKYSREFSPFERGHATGLLSNWGKHGQPTTGNDAAFRGDSPSKSSGLKGGNRGFPVDTDNGRNPPNVT